MKSKGDIMKKLNNDNKEQRKNIKQINRNLDINKTKKNTVSNNKTKKWGVVFSNLKEFIKFYKLELKKTHNIAYIISLIIFGFAVSILLSDSSNLGLIEITDSISRFNIVGEKILITALLIISGLAPFFFVPVIGVIMLPFNLAVSLVNGNIVVGILLSIFIVIELYFTSLATASGIYFCKCSTKRYRYDHSSNFGIDDLKQQLLEISKKTKKLEEFKKKRQEKEEKRAKLKVKVQYKMLLIAFILSIIPIAIISLITGV